MIDPLLHIVNRRLKHHLHAHGLELAKTTFDDFDRAAGGAICEACGMAYYDHPMDLNTLSYDGQPYLNVLCDGKRVKL